MKKTINIIALLLTALFITACGGDGDSSDKSTDSATEQEISLEDNEFYDQFYVFDEKYYGKWIYLDATDDDYPVYTYPSAIKNNWNSRLYKDHVSIISDDLIKYYDRYLIRTGVQKAKVSGIVKIDDGKVITSLSDIGDIDVILANTIDEDFTYTSSTDENGVFNNSDHPSGIDVEISAEYDGKTFSAIVPIDGENVNLGEFTLRADDEHNVKPTLFSKEALYANGEEQTINIAFTNIGLNSIESIDYVIKYNGEVVAEEKIRYYYSTLDSNETRSREFSFNPGYNYEQNTSYRTIAFDIEMVIDDSETIYDKAYFNVYRQKVTVYYDNFSTGMLKYPDGSVAYLDDIRVIRDYETCYDIICSAPDPDDVIPYDEFSIPYINGESYTLINSLPSSVDSTFTYSIGIDTPVVVEGPLGQPDIHEPNNQASEAGVIQYNETITSVLTDNDIDYWTLNFDSFDAILSDKDTEVLTEEFVEKMTRPKYLIKSAKIADLPYESYYEKHAPLLTDLDNDGDNDLIFSSYSDKTLRLQINDGNQSYTELSLSVSQLDLGYGRLRVRTADLDDNGFEDIVVYSTDGFDIFWFENQGELSFTLHEVVYDVPEVANSGYNVIRDLVVGDLNHNGSQDLIVMTGTELIWLKNTGNNTFSQYLISDDSDAIKCISLDVFDYTNDGNEDIVFATSSKIKLLTNEGNESFLTETIDSNLSLKSMHVMDVDNDDDLDILVNIDNSSEPFSWYAYAQDGTSVPSSLPFDQDMDINIPVDLDRDGDIDIVLYDEGERAFSWLENQISSSTLHNFDWSHALIYNEFAIGDVDNDDDLDIIAVDYEQARWVENTQMIRYFTDQNDVPKNSETVSNEIDFSRITDQVELPVSIDTGSLVINGIDTNKQSAILTNHDKLAIKLQTPNTSYSVKKSTLTYGNRKTLFKITTEY